jgi:hypothetical protein
LKSFSLNKGYLENDEFGWILPDWLLIFTQKAANGYF